MKIGLISDTHGHLPADVFTVFSEVDLIIHAGDIGTEEVLIDLRASAPVTAVYGNMDHSLPGGRLPRIAFIKAEELTLCVTHILNSPKSFAYELYKMNKKADVVIFGHTHRPEVQKYNDILFINPGSIAYPRDEGGPSVAILSVAGSETEITFYKVKN